MLYGPLHNETAVRNFEQAVSDAKAQGGTIVYGGKVRGIVILLYTTKNIFQMIIFLII